MKYIHIKWCIKYTLSEKLTGQTKIDKNKNKNVSYTLQSKGITWAMWFDPSWKFYSIKTMSEFPEASLTPLT